MQDQMNPAETANQTHQSNPPADKSSASLPVPDSLTAIRQEVFSKLGDKQDKQKNSGTDRPSAAAGERADKQQQDLTALLKLVRQLANSRLRWKGESSATPSGV